MSSRSLNRVTLIGNLTRDPELKYTPQGTAVCSFAVATNRSWITATGDIKEDVQYHRLVAWQKLAELCGKLLSKGKRVYLEGRIIYRSYVGKDGTQRNITEIVLDDFVLLDTARRTTETSSPPHHAPMPQHTSDKPAPSVTTDQKETKVDDSVRDEKIEPDDIPF